MTTKTTLAQLVLASKKYSALRDEIRLAIAHLNPVELVTPINVKEEKKRWIENAKNNCFGNPYFKYDEKRLQDAFLLRPLLNELLRELNAMKPSKDDIADYFIWEQLYFALNDGIGTTYLAEAILKKHDNNAADVIVNKYGLPEEKNVGLAFNFILDNHAKDELEHRVGKVYKFPDKGELILAEKTLNADEIKEMFEWTMQQYTEKTWPVNIDDNCTSIDVRDKSQYGRPVIVIPTDRKVNGMKLAELIGHEIECHWRSSANADLIGALKCDDELIYEGLAALKDKKFNRDYLGTFNLNSAYYIIAINEALRCNSFADTARTIYDYLPESTKNKEAKAWMYTYRVFRGITNSSNRVGYAFTKDRAYFEGWLFAKSLEMSNQTSYLSFSTLNQKSFERFMEIIDIEDVESSAILDKDIQKKSIEKILYSGTQAEELMNLMANA